MQLIGWEHPSKSLVGGVIFGVGFADYTSLFGWGLGAVAVSAGTIALVGLGIGLIGAAVCSLSPK